MKTENTPNELTAEEFLNKYPFKIDGLDRFYGNQTSIRAMEEYASLKLQELEKESELFEKSAIRWESKFEAKVIELQEANEKEILGDRKIVQLEHEKVVLKAELQQANKEIERSIDIMENGNKIINELETKIKHKDKMLEKMADVIGNVEIYFEQENFNDDYDGVLRDSEETILNNCKELLTKYKQ